MERPDPISVTTALAGLSQRLGVDPGRLMSAVTGAMAGTMDIGVIDRELIAKALIFVLFYIDGRKPTPAQTGCIARGADSICRQMSRRFPSMPIKGETARAE